MRVLIVKLTSMGDLIHALPALTDAQKAIPGIEFDWVVDASFIEIPQLHLAIKHIIKSNHRKWSKAKWQALKSGDLRRFWKELRSRSYDIVLDAQNNLKSAIITRLCRGLRCGTDRKGAREFGAHLAYQKTFPVPNQEQEHAVTRLRRLFSQALGYPMPDTPPDFGIDLKQLPPLTLNLPQPYLVFIHSTTWDTKHWPERYWGELIKLATAAGYHVALPWGGAHEKARAERLGKIVPETTTVMPTLSILEKGSLINDARGIVTVDTGLAHLTAVLNKPAIHLYGPTDVERLGIRNPNQKYLVAEYPCAPCYLTSCKFGAESACFVEKLPPNIVWQNLVEHLAATA